MRNNSDSKVPTNQDSHQFKPAIGTTRIIYLVMLISGLVFILGSVVLIWLLRNILLVTSPATFAGQWHGLGGLILLFLTAGLPFGSILFAAGLIRLRSYSKASNVLTPLLILYVIYFAFHSIRLLFDIHIPFWSLMAPGLLFITLFVLLVWIWAQSRITSDSKSRTIADYQGASGLCFFSAAWQACGLVGGPGFALYPDIMSKLGNQSFVGAQAIALQFFLVLGFLYLILAMHTLRR